MNDTAQLSIIIVNHHSEDVLGDCLRAIVSSRHSFSLEIIIVDNPAGPTTGTDLAEVNIPVKRISSGRLGFGAACNLGATNSSGDFLLFLNPDVQVSEEAIARLFEAMQNNPKVGIVSGRLTDGDGMFQPSCRRFPSLKNLFFSRGSFLSHLGGKTRREYTLPDYEESTIVEAAAAAMMMMAKADFEQVGGFDESFFLYMEDTDLCRRMGVLGRLTIYVPEAGGIHLWGHSTGRYRFRRIIWHHRSVWRYFVKHHSSIAVLSLLGPLLGVNCFLSLTYELFTFKS
ncbi:MAG: glycosyltransferase family 2 protein [FCB group bacterium]|nr:glycosyltransferase family 2 protein [FCB group bacterium]